MTYKLICHRRYDMGNQLGLSRQIYVIDEKNTPSERFELLCRAIDEDIQNPSGSGETALYELRLIESGKKVCIESDGNAWITHITPDKVWFEGLYNQGEGGSVSLAQYKLAVETYVRFLSDPEGKTIEVDFPEN